MAVVHRQRRDPVAGVDDFNLRHASGVAALRANWSEIDPSAHAETISPAPCSRSAWSTSRVFQRKVLHRSQSLPSPDRSQARSFATVQGLQAEINAGSRAVSVR
jgi:hypothetical protein